MEYNKLVRDKIPEIIRRSGSKETSHFADDKEYRQKLVEKLLEEVREFEKTQSSEELADLLEVIYAIAKTKGISLEELEQTRIKKAKDRGSFDKRIILENTNP